MKKTKPTDISILVIGCGPTGVAALFHAKRSGLAAIGIDSGPGILSSVSKYMDNLVLTSHASHYEIGGIPLDCRDSESPTKSEVMHYYARIINMAQLRILDNHKCIRIKPFPDHVEVVAQTPSGRLTFRSTKVMVTSWFVAKDNVLKDKFKSTGIRIQNGIVNPSTCAGRKVAIVGGGMSAYETCVRFMMNGHSVISIHRGAVSKYFHSDFFYNLMDVTRSVTYQHVSFIQQLKSGLLLTMPDKRRVQLNCDVLIYRIGLAVDRDIIRMLISAKVIGKTVASQMLNAATVDDHYRSNPQLDQAALIKLTIDKWPDLYRYLFYGNKGVHFAGGILHIGGSSAGVRTSIYTTKLAIDAISGKSKRRKERLPNLLAEWINKREDRIDLNMIKDIVPMRIRGDKYLLARILRESDFGTKSYYRQYYENVAKDAFEEKVLEEINDRNNIGTIIRTVAKTGSQKTKALNFLLRLFYNNLLTWIPDTSHR